MPVVEAGERLLPRVPAVGEHHFPGLVGVGHHLRQGVGEKHRRRGAGAGLHHQGLEEEGHHLDWVGEENCRRGEAWEHRHLGQGAAGLRLVVARGPVELGSSPERSCRCARFGG